MGRTILGAAFGVGLSLAGLPGCGSEFEEETGSVQQEVVGDFLPGLQVSSPGLLAEAREAFAAVENISEGVGPVFNERGCGNCHVLGSLGGAGDFREARFGTFEGIFFDPLAEEGGTLRQLFSNANFNNPNLPPESRGLCQPGNPTLCCVPVEAVPPEATVQARRLTTPLFGLGLVDAMPDSFFENLAAAQPAAIRGVVNRVPVILPNPGDPTQDYRSERVGRFGWKAAISTLMQFSADAYNNEMGITTQSCFEGDSLNDFALENAPNGLPGTWIDGCDDLAPRQPLSFGPAVGLSPEHGAQVDDVVGVCEDDQTEIQDDVFLFTVFMTALAPTPRDFSDRISIERGEPIFSSIGCAGCHVKTTFVTPANPFPVTIGDSGESITVPGNYAFNPYSDFLKHDMGSLGDRIGEAPPDDPAVAEPDTIAETRQMRTAPLWGIRFRNFLLHDGRTTDIATAIRAHDGQARASRNRFNRLSGTQRHNLIQYIRSL